MGIILTTQQSSQRIDLVIPDSVFQIQALNNGAQRVNSARDFYREWIYFSYPVNNSSWKFPTQTFLWRTAPSANNKQEIDIYVLLKKGAYRFDAQNNKLDLISPDDLRAQASEQRFADAPVQLIFVADLRKRGGASEEEKLRMANIDCGYISQNTYLYCTSEGLVTGARATVNRDALIPKA